jgi:hypothetical protein
MSESRSEAKRAVESYTTDQEQLVAATGRLSRESLEHHVKRFESMASRAVAQRDEGRAWLLRELADVITRYVEFCDWSAGDAQAPPTTPARQPPPAQRVRWT